MVTAAYVLALMLAALPDASPKTRATFPTTAAAIASASSASPLYAGPDGDRRTAATLVAVGTFESSLKPDAQGDCDPEHTSKAGVCMDGGRARSFCLLQVNASNLAYGRTTKDEILGNVGVCVRTGLVLMHDSFRICKRAPEDERLAWYAGGGGTCAASSDARAKSKHRLALARRIYQQAEHADAVTSFVSFDVESEPAPGLERLD